MSEEVKEVKEGKKKGGKLPIIIILAVALGAGGYFGMKSRSSGGPPKPPEAELGHMMSLGDEFIINLYEREFFVRTKVAIQLDEHAKVGGGGGGHEGGGTPDELNAMRDAVVARLNSIRLDDISKPNFYIKLKRLLAMDINHSLSLLEKKKEEKKDDSKEKSDEKDKEKSKEASKEEEAPPYHPPLPGDLDKIDLNALEHKEWDSDKGPVLKIYFTDFATMRE